MKQPFILNVNENIFPYLFGLFLLLSTPQKVNSQVFVNGDLEDEIAGSSVIPSGWEAIPPSAPFCNATSESQASPDLTSITSPDANGGIVGNPQSGNNFICGLRAGNGSFEFDEGIQQTVSGFLIGETYEIVFFQTIVKQLNALDESGFWRVVIDDVLAGDTEISSSDLSYNSTSLSWDQRSVSFTATANTHIIRFLPRDNDPNLALSISDTTGALRMGIDNISLVVPDPILEIAMNDTIICAGECIDLQVFSNIMIESYQWDNTPLVGGALLNVCPTETTTYSVFVTSVSGDTATTEAVVLVNEIPQFDQSEIIQVCEGPIVLDAGNNGAAYLWQDASNDQTFMAESSGTYTVLVTINNCSIERNFDVLIHDVDASFTVDNTIGCMPLKTRFINNSTGTELISDWHWDFGDSLQSLAQAPKHFYEQSGLYEVTLEVITSIGCTDTYVETIEIIAHQQPVAAFSFSPIEAEILEDISFIDQSFEATEWSWNFGNGWSSNEQNPVHVFEEAGDYPVTLMVSNGICSDDIALSLHVSENLVLFVPNSFTPDEDGLNDLLFPIISGADEDEYLFQVFNRGGEIVFETNNISEKWNGVPQQGIKHYSNDGFYNWRIVVKEKASSERMEFQGYTLILR